MNVHKVGFIGFGKMGSALAIGAVKAGVLKAPATIVFDVNPESMALAKKNKFRLAKKGQDVLAQSRIVFLCVKPQQMAETLAPFVVKGQTFVSIAAGLSLASLEKRIGKAGTVIRVMPNTPAFLGASMSVMSLGRRVGISARKSVEAILKSVGEVVILPEKWMDVVTALSGSGPAYVFYLTQAMIEGAVRLGLPKETASRLARQTVYGAALMLKNSNASPEELRSHVTSKGGTTEAALREFEDNQARHIVGYGLKAAARRSKELSRHFH